MALQQTDLRGADLRSGEYHIDQHLAQGGMASVYSASSKSLDTSVAVKVLSPRFATDPSFIDRFHDEATSIAALHHPNIIEVYYFGVEQGMAYIAMRLVTEGTLKERLEGANGPMDLNSAARLTAQVAAALNYAHERGLVHLDVKPANILLGSASWPLLSDFGITRMAGDAREGGHRVAGTPAYMSPEQWQGKDIDGRSDQYSLGLTFYELVTGRRPFAGETSAELKAQHMAADPPAPRTINPGIPGPVEEVMLRSLAKDPAERFPTCGDFAEALVEAVERSRGMQLETKQAIVSAAPNLVALAVLSLLAPFLVGLPDRNLALFGYLTLDWPVALLIACLQAALLLGIRWHVIGVVTRLVASIVDAVDRFSREYVHFGTDAEGPLHVEVWRNAAVASAEGLVNVIYLFVIYQIVGAPFIQTAVRVLSSAGAFYTDALVQTAVAALVLLFAGAIVLKIRRSSGPVVAVFALAVCWGFVSALPVVDQTVWDGRLYLQWLAKLAVGTAVLLAFLSVRTRIQQVALQYVVPPIERQMGQLQKDATDEERRSNRARLESAANGLVNVAYLAIGYPLVAAPLEKAPVSHDGRQLAALVITISVLLLAGVLVNRLRQSAGVVPAALGLLLCVPVVNGLPLFGEYMLGSSARAVAQPIVGFGAIVILLGIRRQAQRAWRALFVPIVDRQLGSLITAASEAEATSRRSVLQRSADALVNLVYLIVGYVVVVAPATAALGSVGGVEWVSTAIYVLFVLAVLLVAAAFVRGIVPVLRPSQGAITAPPLGTGTQPA